MKIEVSNGELLDKLSILEIKLSRISDSAKKKNIFIEMTALRPLAELILPAVRTQYDELIVINEKLWVIEDRIREFEKLQLFGDEFIQTARQVYLLNDHRAKIKKEINLITDSGLHEEKSYAGY